MQLISQGRLHGHEMNKHIRRVLGKEGICFYSGFMIVPYICYNWWLYVTIGGYYPSREQKVYLKQEKRVNKLTDLHHHSKYSQISLSDGQHAYQTKRSQYICLHHAPTTGCRYHHYTIHCYQSANFNDEVNKKAFRGQASLPATAMVLQLLL